MLTLLIAGSALLLTTPSPTTDSVRTEHVHFAPGATSTTVHGSVRGNGSVIYVVNANAGQTLKMNLKTTNASTSYVVLGPGASSTLFSAAVNGHGFSRKLAETGEYQVKIFLLHNAARRHQVGNYSMIIGVHP